jgi:hypothetical protein
MPAYEQLIGPPLLSTGPVRSIEGLDPDLAVIAGIDLVQWELSVLLGVPTLEGHNRFTLCRRERRRRRLCQPVLPVQAEQQPAVPSLALVPLLRVPPPS